ncbi:MAG: tetratricopeptide repeat protein, partial [Ignavibacteria bacterium]
MQNLIDGIIRELEQKNYFEAIKYCNQLIAQFPKNYIFYEIKGNCYLETGSFVTAIQSYTEAIEYFKLTEGKSNSDVASLYNRRGYARLKLSLYSEAINDFKRSTEYKPDFAEAYNNCGNAYRKLEQYDDALIQCNRAIESKHDFAEAYNNRGNIYYHFSKDNEAIFDYTRAIELKPNYAGAYYNRGAAYYYLQNKLIEAKNDWEKVIKLNPSYEREL